MLASAAIMSRHWHYFPLVVLYFDALAGQVGEVAVSVNIKPFFVLAGAKHVDAVARFTSRFDRFAASGLVSSFDLGRVQVAIWTVLFDIASVVEHYALALSLVQAHAAPHDLLQKADGF